MEQRCLLKTVRSVTSKSKKLYMVYEITPAKELTGGPWYTDQEFDNEFVVALCDFITKYVSFANMANITMINEKVKQSGIVKVMNYVLFLYLITVLIFSIINSGGIVIG